MSFGLSFWIRFREITEVYFASLLNYSVILLPFCFCQKITFVRS